MSQRPVPSAARVRDLYRHHFADARRERLFLSSVSFFTTFAATRGITHAIRHRIPPFHNLTAGGRHLHHLVFGISGLLGSGYLWLLQVGIGSEEGHADEFKLDETRMSRATTILYGAGAALTLDEFALWLNLEDVYWTREGRESIDAVVLFGALLSVGVWGHPFFRAVLREVGRSGSFHR